MKTKPVNDCPVPKGTLVIIGGKEDKTQKSKNETSDPKEVLSAFVSEIRKEKPTLEIVTTASSEGDELFKNYIPVFESLGVKQINRIHHNERGDVRKDPSLIDRLSKADAVFFTGGDQLKLTTIYGGTEMLFLLKQRYIKEHFVIGGTSAGAMALSTPMIYAGNQQKQQISGEVKVAVGLEFLKDVCIDTHFVDRSRMVRMAQVIATNPTSIGIGIEENTALIVRNGLEGEICGSGVIIVLDGRDIVSSNILDFGTHSPLSIQGLKIDILSKENTFIIPQINPPHI